MRTIRNSAFETNSSSCHTITFVGDKLLNYWPKRDYPELRMSSEENYYGGGEYNDPITKAMYFSDALSAYVLREKAFKLVEYYKVAGVTKDDLDEPTENVVKYLVERKNHKGEAATDKEYESCLFNFSEYLKMPDEITDQMEEWMSQIKDSIEAYFENEGTKIIWVDTDGDDWTKTFNPKGSIDHQSNIYEDDACVELAELFMNVPALYKWIMSKEGSLYLDTDS